jgi:hypothetical protein
MKQHTVRWPESPEEWRLVELDDLLRVDHEPPLPHKEWEALLQERVVLVGKLKIDAWSRPWKAGEMKKPSNKPWGSS